MGTWIDLDALLHHCVLTVHLSLQPSAPAVSDRSTQAAFETALAAAEDETDVRAACTARAEADAEMAEFDENIPLDEAGDEEVSKAELEVRQLVKQVRKLVQKLGILFIQVFLSFLCHWSCVFVS